MITFFKDENPKSKKNLKNYKTLNTILESEDTVFIIGATSFSLTLSITGIDLMILPISAGIACTLSLGNKLLHKLIINKHSKYKKQYGKDQQTIKSFDDLYRKSLRDNVVDRKEYERLCSTFTSCLDEMKIDFFMNMKFKKKINFFSHSETKLQPRT